MGLTLECAHCHDHKFDPITQRDHYRFYAFFNSVPEFGEDGRVANAVPIIPAPTVEQQAKMRTLEAAIAELDNRTKWTGKKVKLTVSHADTILTIPCTEPRTPVSGYACTPGAHAQSAETVRMSKHDPITFSLWLKPAPADSDVALLSSMDYATNPASVSFGGGVELRLIDGELEFRSSQRFPNYSVRVRSEGANLRPGEWRHLTLLYAGADKDAMRVSASWVRMFADGREIGTRVLNDDLALPSAKDDKPASIKFRIGWDTRAQSARFTGLLDEVGVWNRALREAEVRNLFESGVLPHAQKKYAAFSKNSAKLEKLRGELFAVRRQSPTVMVMQELPVPRETHILIRGSYDAPGEKVEPGVPEELLGSWPKDAPHNRLGLAQWLTKPDHPLTSRVVVNRFWQQLFGEGIVKTSDNFGMQGEWPSHPELLDWMAREFIESGWNVKALMKMMVLSATYRQSSDASPELVSHDPENRLLARGPRFRLPAEVIRDQALEISGLLRESVGGPSVFPYQPADLYKGIVVAADYPGTKYIESTGDDLYRRSLYTFWKRTVPHPTLNVLDAPDREVCIVRRSVTNTPLQALTLLNDPIFVEAARKFAERVIAEGGQAPESRLTFAFRLATGRLPNERELHILENSLAKMSAAYQCDPTGARGLISIGASKSTASIPPAELAAWTAVANIILNMDEVITKG
jgi:hypothetical protein